MDQMGLIRRLVQDAGWELAPCDWDHHVRGVYGDLEVRVITFEGRPTVVRYDDTAAEVSVTDTQVNPLIIVEAVSLHGLVSAGVFGEGWA